MLLPAHWRRSQGQSVIELVLTLPFLLLLLAGIVDLGQAYRCHALVTNAAYAGAHYGTLHPGDVAGVEARVRSALGASPITISDVQVTGGAVALQPIRVEVQAEIPTILGGMLGQHAIAVSKTVEMMIR